ncbi:hypothetical protein PsYK624_099620 [Phanerochaete sordida]|uniref:Uncharacterized protein n=1 Tax=Phanerochaete sordida TaxID=48140 RepID=A0A9P3GFB2_9APHY|nr:hypothetical protein PsYK624_099620 [Phanerochaete sordida]
MKPQETKLALDYPAAAESLPETFCRWHEDPVESVSSALRGDCMLARRVNILLTCFVQPSPAPPQRASTVGLFLGTPAHRAASR